LSSSLKTQAALWDCLAGRAALCQAPAGRRYRYPLFRKNWQKDSAGGRATGAEKPRAQLGHGGECGTKKVSSALEKTFSLEMKTPYFTESQNVRGWKGPLWVI